MASVATWNGVAATYPEALNAIRSRTARVGVIGLGYVGLPLVKLFVKSGFAVTGFDCDPAKVEKLNAGQSYIKHIGAEDVAAMLRNRRFQATADMGLLRTVQAVVVCVPTPLTAHREPDMSYVIGTAQQVRDHLTPGQLVILESTTYPGTLREVVKPILEETGLRAGTDFFLAYSPEREDPGNPTHTAAFIPKVVGGLDPKGHELAVALYEPLVPHVVPVSSPEVAEACKILENTYRAVNIALVNELKMLFDRMGIDVWEVIRAASTKPFGFQPFYPGPGLGGHCLAGSETVRVRDNSLDTVLPLAELFERYDADGSRLELGEVVLLEPENLETLSLDPETGGAGWRKVSHLFRRPYRGTMIEARLAGNHVLRTTDRHPMLVVENDRVLVREARDLKPGDRVPLFSGVNADPGAPADPRLDLLEVLPDHLIDRLHVRIRGVSWKRYERLLKSRYGWAVRDSIRSDSLAARRYLELEPDLGVTRDQLVLLSGRGSAHTQFPAVLQLTPDFCRLLGYYLSEGCVSEERANPRVRFTFNRDEAEYIRDTRVLLGSLGVSSSIYQGRTHHATTVRAGSIEFGHLLRDVLHAGVASTTMRVPDMIMGASARHHEQLLAGLLRGDGDVDVHIGSRPYSKNGHCYEHQFNSGQVGYFSSSPELLVQVETLFQGLGFHPARKKGKPHLRLNGAENLDRLAVLLGGEKAGRLQRLAAARVRSSSRRNVRTWSGGQTLPVVSVRPSPGNEMVYSMEVPGIHTFATTGGIFVHNCIPIDPFYLSWVAKRYEFHTRFIELAGEVNTGMPDYVVQRVLLALNSQGRSAKGSKVGILGMAYKKDVDDPRESPSFELMKRLVALGADVSYNDPYIPRLPSMRHYDFDRESQELTPEYLGGLDCVLIATDHSCYDWNHVVRHARLVVDTRNATRDVRGGWEKIWKA